MLSAKEALANTANRDEYLNTVTEKTVESIFKDRIQLAMKQGLFEVKIGNNEIPPVVEIKVINTFKDYGYNVSSINEGKLYIISWAKE